MENWVLYNLFDLKNWPAKKHDLKQNENIWGITMRCIYARARQFDTIFALKASLLYRWSEQINKCATDLLTTQQADVRLF